jgi:hypothetical protein
LTGADAIWRVLAPIDLSAAQAGKDVESALDLASALAADLTVLSIVDRRQYADGVRHNWPSNAFGSARPELDIHRVVLPARSVTAISAYADLIRAHIVVEPPQYGMQRLLRRRSAAGCLAVVTSRAMWITPPEAGSALGSNPFRIACVMPGDGRDDLIALAAQTLIGRCGGEVALSDQTGDPARGRSTALLAFVHLS